MGVKRYNGIGMVTEDEFNTGLAGKLDKPDAAGNENDVLTKTADGGEVWAPVSSTGTPADSAVSDSSTNAVQNKVIKKYVDDTADTKANKDGRYDLMVVGAALNIEAPITIEDAFLVRPTGGADVEAADGVAQIMEAKGNSVKFNQLVDTNTTTVTVTSGHKYYARISGTASVATSTGAAISVTGGSDTVIDLTAAEIADLTTVEAVEAWLEANVGLRAYYPYTTGTVLNNCMEGIAAPGYNLLDPATGKAVIIGEYSDLYGNYYGIVGTHGTLTFTDVYGNTSTITPDSDGKFELTVPGELSVASAGADCAVFLWWDGTKKEYQPYELNESFLDVKHIYGKLNGEGDLVRVWPTGAPGLGNLKDSLSIENGAVVAKRVMAEADLGSLSWSFTSSQSNIYLFNAIPEKQPPYVASTSVINAISGSPKIVITDQSHWTSSAYHVSGYNDISAGRLLFTFTDNSATNVASYLNGVKLYYELATPEIYTNLVYQGSSHFADGTPVVLPVTYKVNNWSIESIIPQNTSSALVTAPPVLTCKYSLGAVDLLNTHTDEIADLYATKADTEGSYPGIISGNLVDVNGTGTDQEFVYRPTGGGEALAGNGNGVVQTIKGRTLVWNQLINHALYPTYSSNGITFTNNGDGTYTVSGEATANAYYAVGSVLADNHKYLIVGSPSGGSNSTYHIRMAETGGSLIGYETGSGVIITNTAGISIFMRVASGVDMGTGKKFFPQLIDLTAMFQAGNEPSTVAEFTAIYKDFPYAYNTGTLLPYKGTGLKVTGVNQFNADAIIGSATGITKTSAGWSGTSANFRGIGVIWSNKTGYGGRICVRYKVTTESGGNFRIKAVYTDGTSGNVAVVFGSSYDNYDLTASGKVVDYMYFDYGTTKPVVLEFCCISFDNPALNGTYKPYTETLVNIDAIGKTAKDGDGNPIVPFPEGMHGTPTKYDVATKEGGSLVQKPLNLGVVSVSYSSGFFLISKTANGVATPRVENSVVSAIYTVYNSYTDNDLAIFDGSLISSGFASYIAIRNTAYTTVADFKAAMAGVYLVVPLATPVPFTWDEPLEMIYPAPAGGTEAIIPQGVDESGVPATAPLKATIFYSKDYVQTINDMPKDFDTTASIDALTTELATTLSAALNGTLTITRGAYDESGKKYGWTVSFTSDEEE